MGTEPELGAPFSPCYDLAGGDSRFFWDFPARALAADWRSGYGGVLWSMF